MENVLNIYKPKGLTSQTVVSIVKRKLKVKKAGHAGTLDPMAEGVLIVLLNEATKKQDEIMKKDKEYIAEIALGFETDTYDLEGKITNLETDIKLEILKKELTEEKVKKVLSKFLGVIKQTVPAFSAVKIQGQKLYNLARREKEINLPIREVTIYEIELLNLSLRKVELVDKELFVLKIKVVCGSGTYIRSLAKDIGNNLGTFGTMISLVRTRSGDFKLKDSLNIDKL